jgi:hypothetical protein
VRRVWVIAALVCLEMCAWNTELDQIAPRHIHVDRQSVERFDVPIFADSLPAELEGELSLMEDGRIRQAIVNTPINPKNHGAMSVFGKKIVGTDLTVPPSDNSLPIIPWSVGLLTWQDRLAVIRSTFTETLRGFSIRSFFYARQITHDKSFRVESWRMSDVLHTDVDLEKPSASRLYIREIGAVCDGWIKPCALLVPHLEELQCSEEGRPKRAKAGQEREHGRISDQPKRSLGNLEGFFAIGLVFCVMGAVLVEKGINALVKKYDVSVSNQAMMAGIVCLILGFGILFTTTWLAILG